MKLCYQWKSLTLADVLAKWDTSSFAALLWRFCVLWLECELEQSFFLNPRTGLFLFCFSSVAAGTRGHDQIHQPGEPGCVPPPHCGAAGYRHVLHRLVLRLWGDINKIHTGCLQRAADLPRGITFHGVWCAVPTTLGWDICMKVTDLKKKKKMKERKKERNERHIPV